MMLLNLVWGLMLVVGLRGQSSPETAKPTCPQTGPFCFTLINFNSSLQFILQYSKDTENELGYMAVGLGPDMKGSDMMITWFNSNSRANVKLMKGIGHDHPESKNTEGKVRINSKLSDFKNQTIVFDYILPTKTSEWEDPFPIIWAYSPDRPTNRGEIKRHESRGSLKYSFVSESVESDGISSSTLWHGCLMILAWLVLPTVAIFIARFMKSVLGVWWFRIHFTLFIATGIIAIIAIIIMIMKNGVSLDNGHAIIGTVIMSFYVIQMILGVVIDQLYSPRRTHIPLQDKLHWWLGRISVLLAIINIMYGITIVGNPAGLWIPTILIVIVSISMLVWGSLKLKSH